MDELSTLIALASGKYAFCEEAKAANRALNRDYEHATYESAEKFQITLLRIGRNSPDITRLTAGLTQELDALFDEVAALWFDVASRRLKHCRSSVGNYGKKVEAKRKKLPSIRTAKALAEYEHAIARQAAIIDQYDAAPPRLSNALSDDWTLHFGAIKGVVEELTQLETGMSSTIATAEKEAREKEGHWRGRLTVGFSLVSGGGVTWIIDHWHDAIDIITGFF